MFARSPPINRCVALSAHTKTTEKEKMPKGEKLKSIL